MTFFTRIFTTAMAAALLLAGCVSEEPPYAKDGPATGPSETGFLSLDDITLRVITDLETEVQKDKVSSAPVSAAIPAADTAPDTGAFLVEIFDQAGVSALKTTFGELAKSIEPLELAAGNYRLEIASGESIPAAAWDQPSYGASREFSILREQTTSLGEVICTLRNIKATVVWPAELTDILSDATTATVSLGANSLTFSKEDSRAAFFLPAGSESTLEFKLEGTFAGTDSPIALSKSITGVKSGQWREITFDIDSSAPTITLAGHDITQPVALTAEMFDDAGNCTEPFAFDLTSPNGIRSLTVTVGSDNEEFLAALSSQQIPLAFDLCTVESSSPLYEILRGFGYPLGDEVKGQKAKSFDIAAQMPLLYQYDGTHTLSFEITDANRLSAEALLTLNVSKSTGDDGPVIEWVGYDITQSYPLEQVEKIEVSVKAPAGIKSFYVTIQSEELIQMLHDITMDDLTQPFDLCTITGDAEGFLQGINFKTGADILNQTEVSFDITVFIDILKVIPDDAYTFSLDVTDNNGKVASGAIQLTNTPQ